MGPIIDSDRRRHRAKAQAIDWLEGDRAIVPGRMLGATKDAFGRLVQRVGTPCLAGLGAAQLHEMPAHRLLAKMRVVGDHAMNLGTRKIQSGRDRSDRSWRNATKAVLHCMEQRQQGTWKVAVLRDQVVDRIG